MVAVFVDFRQPRHKKRRFAKNTISRMEDENGKIEIKNERLKKQIQEIKNNPDKMDKICAAFL